MKTTEYISTLVAKWPEGKPAAEGQPLKISANTNWFEGVQSVYLCIYTDGSPNQFVGTLSKIKKRMEKLRASLIKNGYEIERESKTILYADKKQKGYWTKNPPVAKAQKI